jgi:hypothetical protein
MEFKPVTPCSMRAIVGEVRGRVPNWWNQAREEDPLTPHSSKRRVDQQGPRTRHRRNRIGNRSGRHQTAPPGPSRGKGPEGPDRANVHTLKQKPSDEGSCVPEVGLELHSSLCKRWAPAETYGIRASPTYVGPSSTPIVCTPPNSPFCAPHENCVPTCGNAVVLTLASWTGSTRPKLCVAPHWWLGQAREEGAPNSD